MDTEHRKFARHQVSSHMIFLFSNYSPVKGWLKDISKGGMAFEYIPTDDCVPKPEINLILAGDAFPFYLPDILCKTIYDIKVNDNDRPFKGPGTRRCGVQYAKLDAETQDKLSGLLNNEAIRSNI